MIACPPPSEAFAGLDILSSLRMPRGIAPLVVLDAENAALAAAKMLALAAPRSGSVWPRLSEERDRFASSDAHWWPA